MSAVQRLGWGWGSKRHQWLHRHCWWFWKCYVSHLVVGTRLQWVMVWLEGKEAEEVWTTILRNSVEKSWLGDYHAWMGDYHAWIGLDIRGLRRARAWCLITHKQVYRSGSRYCPIDTDSLGRFRGCRFAGWRPFLTGEWGWHVVLSFSDWGEQPVGKIVHLHCRGMILFLNIILKTTVRKNNHTLGYCGIVKLL